MINDVVIHVDADAIMLLPTAMSGNTLRRNIIICTYLSRYEVVTSAANPIMIRAARKTLLTHIEFKLPRKAE